MRISNTILELIADTGTGVQGIEIILPYIPLTPDQISPYLTQNEFIVLTELVASNYSLSSKGVESFKFMILAEYYIISSSLPGPRITEHTDIEALASRYAKQLKTYKVISCDNEYLRSDPKHALIVNYFDELASKGQVLEAFYVNKDLMKATNKEELTDNDIFIMENLEDKAIYLFPKTIASNLNSHLQSLLSNLYVSMIQLRNYVTQENSTMDESELLSALERDYGDKVYITDKAVAKYVNFIIEHEMQHTRQSVAMIKEYSERVDSYYKKLTSDPTSVPPSYFYENVLGAEAEHEANLVGLDATMKKYGPPKFREL